LISAKVVVFFSFRKIPHTEEDINNLLKNKEDHNLWIKCGTLFGSFFFSAQT
jgi:hypothetical protein